MTKRKDSDFVSFAPQDEDSLYDAQFDSKPQRVWNLENAQEKMVQMNEDELETKKFSKEDF